MEQIDLNRNLRVMDVFEFPNYMRVLEIAHNNCRDRISNIESKMKHMESDVYRSIQAETDSKGKRVYKNKNACDMELSYRMSSNTQYVSFSLELNELTSQSRDIQSRKDECRRCLRLLEHEFMQSGLRRLIDVPNYD